MQIRGKTIFLISSELWGKLFISKHNYAIALAKRGNKVYYFNPIDHSLRPGTLRVEPSGHHPNLLIVHSRPLFPMWFKFHARILFDRLIRWHVKWVQRKLGAKPDIIWDFYCSYLYDDLSAFGASLSIFQPVDQLADEVRNKKADVVVSISDNLLNQYYRKDVPSIKVNHGLGEAYVQLAERAPVTAINDPVKAGYIGNLSIDSLDRETLLKTITMNPQVQFHFIGPVTMKENNLGHNSDENEFNRFIGQLRAQKNVVLYGAKTQQEIAAMLDSFDVLLVCYKATPTYKNDNTHKVLEYLASGKVVVSTYLSAYAGSELVVMSPADRNEEWPAVFAKVIADISAYNTPALQERRKSFAAENSYERQIQKIEKFIELVKNGT